MTQYTKFILTGLLSMIITVCSYAQLNTKPVYQSTTSKAVMDDFMNLRFGMFVHWGPVSLRGTEIGWSRGHEVAVDDYDNLYKEFNPVLFNADTWVKTASDAGMKYLTITAKHHDGFCLWPAINTDYDIEATPYKKDIVAQLSAACRKYDVRFCIYFTILDWHDADYPIHNDGKTADPDADMSKYQAKLKTQLKQLIESYDPYMIWFDGQWESPWTDEMGKELYTYLKGLKPDLIMNNRLGKEMTAVNGTNVDYTKMIGDYDTPEQRIGNLTLDFPWESCITIGNQWAWKPNDKLKTLQECLHTLIKTASANGNLLFNVGPMPDGRIEQRQIDILTDMGQWLNSYGESIYNTRGGPYSPNNLFSATRNGNKIFIHLFNPLLTEIKLPLLPKGNILKCSVLHGDDAKLTVLNDGYSIVLPEHMPDKISNVLVLELDCDALTIPVIETPNN